MSKLSFFRQWRPAPTNRTVMGWTPISDVSLRKSEPCRTDFSRAEALSIIVFELLQSRRIENRQELVADLH